MCHRVSSNRLDSESAGCLLCVLRSLSICGALEEKELLELARLSQRMRLNSKTPLFSEGDQSDAAYNVTEGTVRLSKLLPDGRRQIVGFALPGDFIGVAPGGCYGFSADAIEPVMVCRFLKEPFARFVAGKPWMLQRMNDFARQELVLAQDHMVSLGRRSAEEKVAAFLIGWRNRLQRIGRAAKTVYLPMSRQDIADYLGLTVETVSRTLTKLERDGVIVIVPGGVRLLDTRRAEALAAA
jgi:CRP/FNR family transcriptional regulator